MWKRHIKSPDRTHMDQRRNQPTQHCRVSSSENFILVHLKSNSNLAGKHNILRLNIPQFTSDHSADLAYHIIFKKSHQDLPAC
uniref:Uncharacterized protein n=1 Tax=Anguilla anguilla TaxID=7936 RepID=A0A0E9TP84_ANGAN